MTAGGLEALLTTRSLSDPDLMSATDILPDQRILPDVSVLKIGGQSLMDRGRDAGCYLVAETYGCKQMIFVKDEDGLYTANPKTGSSATLIPRITVDELIERDLPDLVVERPVLELMARARFVR